MKELAESSKLYTETEIKAAAAAEKAALAAEHQWNSFTRNIAAWFGSHEVSEMLSDSLKKAVDEGFQGAGSGPNGSFTKEDQQRIYETAAEQVLKQGKKLGFTKEETLEYAAKTFGPNGSTAYRFALGSENADKVYSALETLIQDMNENEDFSEKSTQAITTAVKSNAVVSSLQAIGAGDIQSIFAGTYQDQMLDAQTRTASATEQVVKNTTPPTNPVEEPPARAGH